MEQIGQTQQFTTNTTNQQTQTQNEATANKSVSYGYADLVGTNVQAVKPKSKNFTSGDGQSGNYAECPLLYNYGTAECPVVDAWLTELCEVRCRGGIQYKCEQKVSTKPKTKGYNKQNDSGLYNKETYSLMIIFDPQNPETQPCLDKLQEGYLGLAKAIDPFKGDLNLRGYDCRNPEACLPSPVYYKTNTLTNERTGQSPTMWLTLNHWTSNRTLFTLPPSDEFPNGKPIDWKLLYEVEMTLIPLVQWHHVFSGTTRKICMNLVGAIVTDVVKLATITKQLSTMDKILAKNKGLADKVSAQLAGIQMEKQDELDDATPQPKPANLPSEEGGQMFQTKGGRQQGDQDGLRDFLGGVKTPSGPPVGIPTGNPGSANQGSQQVWSNQATNQEWQQVNYQGHSGGQQTPGQFQNVPQSFPQVVPQGNNVQNSNNEFNQYQNYQQQAHLQGQQQFNQNQTSGVPVQVQLPVQNQGGAHVQLPTQLPTQLPPQVQAQLHPQVQFQQRPVIQLAPGGQQATMRLE